MEKTGNRHCCICDKQLRDKEIYYDLSDGVICEACADECRNFNVIRRKIGDEPHDLRYTELSRNAAWREHSKMQTATYLNAANIKEHLRERFPYVSDSSDDDLIIVEHTIKLFYIRYGIYAGKTIESEIFFQKCITGFHLDVFHESDAAGKEPERTCLRLCIELETDLLPFIATELTGYPFLFHGSYWEQARAQGQADMEFLQQLTGLEPSAETETWLVNE